MTARPRIFTQAERPIASMLRYAEARLKHRGAFLTAAEAVASRDGPSLKSVDSEDKDRLNQLAAVPPSGHGRLGRRGMTFGRSGVRAAAHHVTHTGLTRTGCF